jgi:hypothetical protein
MATSQQTVDFQAEIKVPKSKLKTRFRCKQEQVIQRSWCNSIMNFRQGVTLLVTGMNKIYK